MCILYGNRNCLSLCPSSLSLFSSTKGTMGYCLDFLLLDLSFFPGVFGWKNGPTFSPRATWVCMRDSPEKYLHVLHHIIRDYVPSVRFMYFTQMTFISSKRATIIYKQCKTTTMVKNMKDIWRKIGNQNTYTHTDKLNILQWTYRKPLLDCPRSL